jgi:hydrogenase expression/formation protein HypC
MCLAVPGKIIDILPEADANLRCGKVDFAGVQREVSLAFTPDAVVGDYVLVHVGFAISVMDELEARRVFATLNELERLEALGGEVP